MEEGESGRKQEDEKVKERRKERGGERKKERKEEDLGKGGREK